MREIVFLLEEESAKSFLESLLPRILEPYIYPRLIPFEGKQDLEKQITKKIRGYLNPNARFIILRDQDSHPDCKALKASLIQKCQDAGKINNSLVRVACKELETFYLADLTAVEVAMNLNGLSRHQGMAKFRSPDSYSNPSKELSTLTKSEYQKVSHSRLIGKYIDINNQRSSSFKHLVMGIKKLQAELLQIQEC
jgi:hypothetical protein